VTEPLVLVLSLSLESPTLLAGVRCLLRVPVVVLAPERQRMPRTMTSTSTSYGEARRGQKPSPHASKRVAAEVFRVKEPQT
jgi:hypothetical protein